MAIRKMTWQGTVHYPRPKIYKGLPKLVKQGVVKVTKGACASFRPQLCSAAAPQAKPASFSANYAKKVIQGN